MIIKNLTDRIGYSQIFKKKSDIRFIMDRIGYSKKVRYIRSNWIRKRWNGLQRPNFFRSVPQG